MKQKERYGVARVSPCLAMLASLALLLSGVLVAPVALARVQRAAPAPSAAPAALDAAPPVGDLHPAVVDGQGPQLVTPADELTGSSVLVLAGGTRVGPQQLYSSVLDRDMLYEVILPPDYASSRQEYPVLYMLHGVAGGATEWLEIGLHEAADELWSSGRVPPFIIVLPDTGPSYYLNHADGGPRWEDFIIQELVPEVDATYRTRPDPRYRAVGGLSMGGDGALRLALRHPDIFGIVGAHSPTTRLSYDQLPGTIFGDEEYWHQNSALWLIANTDAAAQLKIWIDDGLEDVWVASAEALHEALQERGIEHAFALFEGGHEGEYWIAHQRDYLRFYGAAFSGGDWRASASTLDADATP